MKAVIIDNAIETRPQRKVRILPTSNCFDPSPPGKSNLHKTLKVPATITSNVLTNADSPHRSPRYGVHAARTSNGNKQLTPETIKENMSRVLRLIAPARTPFTGVPVERPRRTCARTNSKFHRSRISLPVKFSGERPLCAERFWHNNARPFQSTCTPRSPFIYPFTCLSKVLLPRVQLFTKNSPAISVVAGARPRAWPPFARGKGGFSIKRSVTPAQCRCVGYCTQRALGTHPDRSGPGGKRERGKKGERALAEEGRFARRAEGQGNERTEARHSIY